MMSKDEGMGCAIVCQFMSKRPVTALLVVAQGSVTIAAGGVLPNIHSVLLPKKPKGGKGATGSVSQEF